MFETMVWPVSLAIGMLGASAGRIVEALTAHTDEPVPQYITQLGVTGACIMVAWFMLQRGDRREAKVQESEAKAQHDLIGELRVQLEHEKRRAELAEERAEAIQRRLLHLFHEHPGPQD